MKISCFKSQCRNAALMTLVFFVHTIVAVIKIPNNKSLKTLMNCWHLTAFTSEKMKSMHTVLFDLKNNLLLTDSQPTSASYCLNFPQKTCKYISLNTFHWPLILYFISLNRKILSIFKVGKFSWSTFKKRKRKIAPQSSSFHDLWLQWNPSFLDWKIIESLSWL
jgi:hypothetical protein